MVHLFHNEIQAISRIGKTTENHVREFILYLQTKAKTPYGEKPLSGATIQGYVRTLKAFFSWVEREEGYLASSQIGRIQIPKANSKIISTFTPEQIDKLASICQTSNGDGQRNLTILLLLLDTGIRVSELVNIGMEDIYLAEGCIKIRVAIGGKERIVPVGSLVQKSLWKYMYNFRTRPLTQLVTRLFLSDKGLPLTKSGIQQMLRRYGRRAGLNGVRCSPHTFRHTFATLFIANTDSPSILKEIMGHSSFQTTEKYIHPKTEDLQKQHKLYSPLTDMFKQ